MLHLCGRYRNVNNDLISCEMKFTPILILIVLITLSIGCKKDNSTIMGKWREAKMRVYNQDITTGALSGDTTYQSDTFGKFDYVEFYSNGICVVSATEQVSKVQDTWEYTYAQSGTGFLVTPAHTDPYIISGVSTVYTASRVSSNTVVLHAVTSYLNPSVPYKTITDSYYNK
jgi:hypothetical protein